MVCKTLVEVLERISVMVIVGESLVLPVPCGVAATVNESANRARVVE